MVYRKCCGIRGNFKANLSVIFGRNIINIENFFVVLGAKFVEFVEGTIGILYFFVGPIYLNIN